MRSDKEVLWQALDQPNGDPTVYQVTCEIDFCYGHRLLNYAGKCRHLHGHNGRVVVSISGGHLDGCGMVRDFTEIKQVLRGWIDRELDHRMILHEADPVVPFLKQLNEPMYLLTQNPTAESIAQLIFDFAVQHGLPVDRVDLWETPRCYASYLGSAGSAHKKSPADP